MLVAVKASRETRPFCMSPSASVALRSCELLRPAALEYEYRRYRTVPYLLNCGASAAGTVQYCNSHQAAETRKTAHIDVAGAQHSQAGGLSATVRVVTFFAIVATRTRQTLNLIFWANWGKWKRKTNKYVIRRYPL